MDFFIRDIRLSELDEVLALVLRVFMEFEAPEYSDEGVREFKDFITKENITVSIQNNELAVMAAFADDQIVGMIAIKSGSHISLLFVDKQYHRRGIAKALFRKVQNRCDTKNAKEITVNSSPYAVPVYRHLGFVPVGSEQCVNGMRFTPMKYSGFHIRAATTEDDFNAVSPIFCLSWRKTYKGIVPQAYLDSIEENHWCGFLENIPPSDIFLAFEYDKLIGVSTICAARDEIITGWGEIVAIYLLPDYCGRGYGGMLLKKAVDVLKERDYSGIYLWVLEENEQAKGFYKKKGFQETQDRLRIDIGGKELTEVRYILK